MLLKVFEEVVLLSIMGSVLALAILAVKATFRQKLNARLHYYIWFILLVRLLIPFTIDSPLSLTRFMPQGPAAVVEQPAATQGMPEIVTTPVFDNPDDEPAAATKPLSYYLQIAATVWLAGTAAVALYMLFVNLLFLYRLGKLPVQKRRDITRLLNQCKSLINVSSAVTVQSNSAFRSPMLYGLVLPRILISPELIAKLTQTEMKYVLLHELAHLKRKDLLVNMVLMLVQAVYWFNPVVWYAIYKMKQDCEIACDATVLAAIAEEESRQYGNTIISMLQMVSSSQWAPGTVGFVSQYNKRRITVIAQNKKPSLSCTIAAVALCFFFLAGCASLTQPVSGALGTDQGTANTPAASNSQQPTATASPKATNPPSPAKASPTPAETTPTQDESALATPNETSTPPQATPNESGAAGTNRYSVAGFDDAQAFEKTYNKLQALMAVDDKAAVAEYIAYPITVKLDGKKTVIKTESDFIKNYDKIITVAVKAAFLNQKVEDTFVNYKGVSAGQGKLWFNKLAGTKQVYSIIAINN
jgi:beta-lactamase regulating signal transducer with metallopeptidase domain